MAAKDETMASDVAAPRLAEVRRTRARAAIPWRRALIGVALALTGSAAAAEAAGTAEERTVPIDATYAGYLELEKVDCLSAPGTCEFYYRGRLRVSGSRVGNVVIVLHGHFTPEGFVHTGRDYFTGMIRRCGVGSVIHSVRGIIRDLALFPPQKLGFGGSQEWAVIPGSGTGGLAGVRSGSGISTVVARPAGTRMNIERGRVVGNTTCTPS